jgi:hypothetical protein
MGSAQRPVVLALIGSARRGLSRWHEFRFNGVLRSSLPASNCKIAAKMVYLGDAPMSCRPYT